MYDLRAAWSASAGVTPPVFGSTSAVEIQHIWIPTVCHALDEHPHRSICGFRLPESARHSQASMRNSQSVCPKTCIGMFYNFTDQTVIGCPNSWSATCLVCSPRCRPHQDLLARMLGVQRNPISIAAHRLRQAGIISYTRGHIDIDDPQSLEATSYQSYRVVKNSQRSVVEGLRRVATRSRLIIFSLRCRALKSHMHNNARDVTPIC